MKIIYTTQTRDFKDGFAYRNPRYFAAAEKGATEVTVVGDWPAVVEAYGKLGIDAKVSKTKAQSKKSEENKSGDGESGAPGQQGEAVKPLTVPQIKEALAAKGIEIPTGVTKRDDLFALLDAADDQGTDEGA